MAKQLRRQLGDDADHPAYTFIEPRVGYQMEQGEDDGTRDGAVTFEDYTGSVGSVGFSPCAEKPVKPKGRCRKPKPATLSMFEWALTLEQERETEPVGSGR